MSHPPPSQNSRLLSSVILWHAADPCTILPSVLKNASMIALLKSGYKWSSGITLNGKRSPSQLSNVFGSRTHRIQQESQGLVV